MEPSFWRPGLASQWQVVICERLHALAADFAASSVYGDTIELLISKPTHKVFLDGAPIV